MNKRGAKHITRSQLDRILREADAVRRHDNSKRYWRRAAFSMGVACVLFGMVHFLHLPSLMRGFEWFGASAIDLILYSGLE